MEKWFFFPQKKQKTSVFSDILKPCYGKYNGKCTNLWSIVFFSFSEVVHQLWNNFAHFVHMEESKQINPMEKWPWMQGKHRLKSILSLLSWNTRKKYFGNGRGGYINITGKHWSVCRFCLTCKTACSNGLQTRAHAKFRAPLLTQELPSFPWFLEWFYRDKELLKRTNALDRWCVSLKGSNLKLVVWKTFVFVTKLKVVFFKADRWFNT